MNNMDIYPTNMTRVLVVGILGYTVEFAFFKDGMYQTDSSKDWKEPNYFSGWISMDEVRDKLKIDKDDSL